MLLFHSNCLKVIGKHLKNATSAIYSILFITMTPSYSYHMTSFSTADLELNRGSKQSEHGHSMSILRKQLQLA